MTNFAKKKRDIRPECVKMQVRFPIFIKESELKNWRFKHRANVTIFLFSTRGILVFNQERVKEIAFFVFLVSLKIFL